MQPLHMQVKSEFLQLLLKKTEFPASVSEAVRGIT